MTTRAVPTLLPLLFIFLAPIFSGFCDEPKLHVLWDTISPHGNYALGWSTTDPESELSPFEDPTDDSSVTTWLVEVATSNKLIELPDFHFWKLKSKRLDQYWLDTVWSEDSRYLLILLQHHITHVSTTINVLLVEVSAHRAVDVTQRIGDLIKDEVQKNYGGSYFENPWFIETDRFSLFGDAGEHDYDFVFQLNKAGHSLTLAKAIRTKSANEDSDRRLNRSYRKLHGLLSGDDQKALIEEQRAWLTKRDAIKSAAEKEKFVAARTSELENRADEISWRRSD